ncbi:MAG: DUF4236 domain-containing protein [Hyphomicrobiaceae bacterium]
MGVRFQKRIRIFPGVYINLSKSGVSASVGGKGATVNVNAAGKRMVTFGIPGTGLSYRAPLSNAILLALIGVAIVAAIAFYLFPMQVGMLLHWWQPKWFPLPVPAPVAG